MNRFLLFLCALFCSNLQLFAKDTLHVTLYATSQDLYVERPINVNAKVISNKVGNNYFYANKILDTSTNKKVKDSKFIFAIRYKDDVYVNMGYADVITTIGMYIKLDVVGQHAALIYDERMPYKRATGTSNGLAGYAVSKAFGYVDNNHLWSVSDKNKVPIFYCNLTQKEYRNFQMTRNESCLLTFISLKEIGKLKEKYPDHKLKENPYAKDVLSFFEEINKQE
jgi:hypothetical protein